MSRKSRNYILASFFHIMVQGINKEYIFNNHMDKKEYIKLMKKEEDKTNLAIISYCVMDNHVHIVICCRNDKCLAKYMHKINTSYAIYYNKTHNRVGYVYRDRYKSQPIKSESQLFTCINYVHNNPVKAKICNNPTKYEYSTCSEYSKNQNIIKYKIKELNISLTKEEVENDKTITFIDCDEDKKNNMDDCIKNYLKKNKLSMEALNMQHEKQKEIIKILNEKYGVSLRKIAEILNVSREKVRRIKNENQD